MDLPTLTICLNIREELAYGENFLVKANIQHFTIPKATSNLQENNWVKVPFAPTPNGKETAELTTENQGNDKNPKLTYYAYSMLQDFSSMEKK